MLTVRSVLCPVDFSEQSRQALLWASAIARYRGGRLTILCALEPLLANTAAIRLGVDLGRDEIEPALRDFVEATLPERLRQASHIRIEVTVGDPSEAILNAGCRREVGLIVMGTQGLGGFRKLILGSTTEQVLRRTERPVLVVPAAAVSAPAAEHPGVQLRRILLATDFRESAVAATQWASDLASDISVPLVLAHVVEPGLLPQRWQVSVADFESDRIASAQRMLGNLAASLRDTHNDCVVSVGPPADTIASLALEHSADLVVMGLTNAKDSDAHNPGSIAYNVLRLAHVAVVVVPGCSGSRDRLASHPACLSTSRVSHRRCQNTDRPSISVPLSEDQP